MEDRKKMLGRIGMLAHVYYLIDARVRREAESLAAKGYEVHFVCVKEPAQTKDSLKSSEETVNGVHIHRLPLQKKRGSKIQYILEYVMTTVMGLWKLMLLSLRGKFDVIHIHNMPDILVLAGLIPRWAGADLILDVHDPMSEMFEANYNLPSNHFFIRLLKLQERISYKLATHLLTVSDPMAENVAQKRGCSEKAIKVIHNFPDPSRFPIREDRKEWPYNRDRLVLLYCGTVTEHYRLDIVVRALAEVSRSIPNIEFWILGGGNRLEGVLTLAKDIGISEKVKHFKPVPQEEVIEIMAKADVGITTHQSGAFGDLYFSTKIIEFMTQGLPVISSRTKTIEKYIPEDAIFYFEAGNVEDLAKEIVRMWKNPAMVLRKIGNSKKVVSKYNWEDEKEKFLTFYEELLKS